MKLSLFMAFLAIMEHDACLICKYKLYFCTMTVICTLLAFTFMLIGK